MSDTIGATTRWVTSHWGYIVCGAAAAFWVAVFLRAVVEWRRTPPGERKATRDAARNEKRDSGDW